MSTRLNHLLLLVAGAFLIVGCEGSDGAAGAAGPSGAAGSDGFSCWDLNQNSVADPDEDLNGDGAVDTLDCRAPLPGTAVLVSGSITTPDGPLDRFVKVSFVPAGGGSATEANVANDGTYTIELAAGDLPEIPDGEFIGSENCAICHTVQYASFAQSGHPFKLNKVENNQAPTYPFTNLNGLLERVTDDDAADGDPKAGTDNTLGTPVTWDDVSYVIGGYFWKARLVDQNGAVVTGSSVQYNFQTDAMSGYHDNETDKHYNCGNCHTTGWRHQDAVLNDNRQDDLQFMDGTFFEGGVHCEACHGAGSAHAKFSGIITRDAIPRSLADLTAADQGFGDPVACGECHTRDGERDYPSYLSGFDNALAAAEAPDPRPNEMGGRIAASGGLIKHHEQYDEILGINPDTLESVRSPAFMATHGDCMTCHNPHGSSVNVGNPLYTGVAGHNPSNDACLTCHGDYDTTLRAGGMLNLACADCHMPDLAKSAVATAGELERPTVGDVATHIFRIALDSTQPQFNEAGSFAYPAIDEDFACMTCHNTAPGAVIGFAIPDGIVDTYIYHNNIP